MQVFVYRNLHNHCLSIKAMEGPLRGKVIAHAHRVLLEDAVFKVSLAGRNRVLAERQKNVHAGVVGTLLRAEVLQFRYEGLVFADFESPQGLAQSSDCLHIKYDPYKADHFFEVDSKAAVNCVPFCEVTTRGVFASSNRPA